MTQKKICGNFGLGWGFTQNDSNEINVAHRIYCNLVGHATLRCWFRFSGATRCATKRHLTSCQSRGFVPWWPRANDNLPAKVCQVKFYVPKDTELSYFKWASVTPGTDMLELCCKLGVYHLFAVIWLWECVCVGGGGGGGGDAQHHLSTCNATRVKKKRGVETIHFAQFWWKIWVEILHFPHFC